jgi:hypothetical protein
LLFVFVKISKLKKYPIRIGWRWKAEKDVSITKARKRTNDIGLNKFKVNGGIYEKSAA